MASSPRLARVQPHCGWANMTKAALPCTRWMEVPLGHSSGGDAGLPGVVEYRHSLLTPKPTAGSQIATAAAMITCLRNPERRDTVLPLYIGRRRRVMQQLNALEPA